MTISTQARRRDFLRTLDAMVAAVGDRAVVHVFFTSGQTPVETTLPTTWDELLQRGMVSDQSGLSGPGKYELTPQGWADGLLTLPPADLDDRCGRLAAAIKLLVKSRDRDESTVLKELATSAGLPDGWVWNAVQGGLLDRRFPGRGFRLRGFEDGIVCHLRVPRAFGLKAL